MLGKNYRVRQAAEWLGVRERTLWEWIYSGKIRSARVGHCRVIREADLAAMVVDDPPRKRKVQRRG